MPVIRSRPRGLLRPRLTYRSAAAAASIAAVAALAACGSGSASGSAAAGAGPAGAAGGASGTLNWEWELPTSWDPVTSSAGWDMHVLGLLYASVTTLNARGDVQPGLASSWKYAADGKSVPVPNSAHLIFICRHAYRTEAPPRQGGGQSHGPAGDASIGACHFS